MAERPPTDVPARGPKPPAKSERVTREAAALRENLRKRKEQARARATSPDQPKPPRG